MIAPDRVEVVAYAVVPSRGRGAREFAKAVVHALQERGKSVETIEEVRISTLRKDGTTGSAPHWVMVPRGVLPRAPRYRKRAPKVVWAHECTRAGDVVVLPRSGKRIILKQERFTGP